MIEESLKITLNKSDGEGRRNVNFNIVHIKELIDI